MCRGCEVHLERDVYEKLYNYSLEHNLNGLSEGIEKLLTEREVRNCDNTKSRN